MSVDPAVFAPLGGIIGGAATAAGVYFSRRATRHAKRVADYLLADLVMGHQDIPGVEDRDSLDKRLSKQEHRLAAVVINVQDISSEIHNGMKKQIQETHELAQSAARTATTVRQELTDYRRDHP